MSYYYYVKPGFRNLVVGTETKVPLEDGRMVTAINFDNAATTPPFFSVMQEILNFAPWYSSVHRGTGYKSRISSELFEKSRVEALNFVKADPDNYVAIFVKNTTEAINKLSYKLCENNKECVVLSTDMEHHSNDLPWRNKYKVDYISVDSNGKLIMDDLESKLEKYRGYVKLVTAAGASNVTGYMNPIYKIAKLCHNYGAKLCVDGAQLVPHVPVDMRSGKEDEHIDFLVFSAHKMYAPFGVGVLIGPKAVFQEGPPDYMGGGTVKMVTHEFVIWDDPPLREEAGSPNLMGAAALTASIRTLKMIGMKNIEEYERSLTSYALERLNGMKGIKLYGNAFDCQEQVGIIPFNIEGMDHSLTASILSREAGIAVRNGCFCAQPYVQKLLNIDKDEINHYAKNTSAPRPGMVRISFGLYNLYSEIDSLARALGSIIRNKDFYINKYRGISNNMIQ